MRDHAGANRRRASIFAMAGATVVLSGLGCQATTMSAASAGTPILIGPIACIGCAPTQPPSLSGEVPVVDSSSIQFMAAPNAWAWTRVRPSMGRKTQDRVADRCRVDFQISSLHARAYGVWALFFAMTSVEVEVRATPRAVAGGSCYGSRPPEPPSGPYGAGAFPPPTPASPTPGAGAPSPEAAP
jgi:hypothetical protein